jgi:hypothetical protein
MAQSSEKPEITDILERAGKMMLGNSRALVWENSSERIYIESG